MAFLYVAGRLEELPLATIKQKVRSLTRSFGFEINRVWENDSQRQGFPLDFSGEDIEIISRAKPYTLTSHARMFGLIRAIEYTIQNEIEGSVVECGVWKGGSMMVVALTLLRLGIRDKDLYLFDTYEGMTPPQERDVSVVGERATWLYEQKRELGESWNYADLDGVQEVIASTGYDMNHVHFIKGKVEDTLPNSAPPSVSLLRLDTDLYESTRHELIHLFPRLSVGGVLILDDYGYFKGAREATDEYIEKNRIRILLTRMDNTGRLGIKVEPCISQATP